MKLSGIIKTCLFLLLVTAVSIQAADLQIYDGETPKTDLDRSNGGSYYELWWDGAGDNSLTDSTTKPHSGKKCIKWECKKAWTGGALMVDPNWVGLNVEAIKGIEFWARGEKGGENVVLEFFDRNLGKPGEKDGHMNQIKLEGLTKEWKKFSYTVFDLTNKAPGKRPFDMNIFEGFMISGSDAGTVAYLDDMKMIMGEREIIEYAPIKINKVGYRPIDFKEAIINKKVKKFEIIDAKNNKSIFSGTPKHHTDKDSDSGDYIAYADFTEVKTPGKYYIKLSDGTKSPEFRIGKNVYKKIWIDAMRTYYFQRCGMKLEKKHAGEFARSKCHVGDAKAEFSKRKDGTTPKGTVDLTGGWHDAGDDNKYSWMYGMLFPLGMAYELFPQKFPDNHLNIAESGNGRSDLLDEIIYEIKWFLKMQVQDGPEAGLVYEKIAQEGHDSPKDPWQHIRKIRQPMGDRTAEFAASMAMMAYVLRNEKDKDSKALVKQCRKAAEKAWKAYIKHTKDGTISYPDKKPVEYDYNKLHAAAELYRLTGKKKYHNTIKADLEKMIAFYEKVDIRWGQGKFYPFLVYNSMPEKMQDKKIAKRMKDVVRNYRKLVNEYIESNGYKVPFGNSGHFCWGSNGHLYNNGVIFYYLYLWDKKDEDLQKVKRTLDYNMGLNAVDMNMYTRYGEDTLLYHGHYGTPDPKTCPPGYLTGGVNMHDETEWMSEFLQKRYRNTHTNWTVNENSIGYQAPAVFVMTVFAPEPKK